MRSIYEAFMSATVFHNISHDFKEGCLLSCHGWTIKWTPHPQEEKRVALRDSSTREMAETHKSMHAIINSIILREQRRLI